MMKAAGLIMFIAICALAFYLIQKWKSERMAEVDACVARGVAYFKDIGSYPTLQSYPNTGRRAEDVARERCQRTLTAF